VVEVTAAEGPERVKTAPKEGVFVHGLSLEGGSWDKTEITLCEVRG